MIHLGDVVTEQPDATRAGADLRCHSRHQRGLSGSAGAAYDDPFAGVDPQGEAAERGDIGVRPRCSTNASSMSITGSSGEQCDRHVAAAQQIFVRHVTSRRRAYHGTQCKQDEQSDRERRHGEPRHRQAKRRIWIA